MISRQQMVLAHLTCRHAPKDPWITGTAYVKVGGTAFHKSLRIETVKPNRLKINLKLPEKAIQASTKEIPVMLTSTWLTNETTASTVESQSGNVPCQK